MINDTRPDIKKKQNKPKLKIKNWFKWDNTVDISNILTFLTILIAAIALYHQKKEVDLKVKDLQEVVNNLEAEKKAREMSNSKLTLDKITGDSYNLNYTISQLKHLDNSNQSQFIETLEQINKIADILSESKHLTDKEIESLNRIIEINIARQEIYSHALIFSEKVNDFEAKKLPKAEEYANHENYLKALENYNFDLERNNTMLLHILDSLIQGPSAKLRLIYGEKSPSPYH